MQWTCPVPCIRTRRVAHKRLDSDDQPPAKCARLSAEAGEAQGLLGSSPGSPVSPVANPLPATHVGPSRIGPFLILPLADRESVHSAMNTDTGDELLCKVCAIARHCAISLNEWCFETTGCSTARLTCHHYFADFIANGRLHATSLFLFVRFLFGDRFLKTAFKRRLSNICCQACGGPVLALCSGDEPSEVHLSSTRCAHLHTRHRNTPRQGARKGKKTPQIHATKGWRFR